MNTRAGNQPLPQARRSVDDVSGHWLLARLGKRVLRPGGVELTRLLLAGAEIADADVVELAPGLGRTAAEIVRLRPHSYLGVEQDPAAARVVRPVVAALGDVRTADAAHSGLPSEIADVVVGEAMLTMQNRRTKGAIIAEAARLLRPGGRYAIHELALTPDDMSEEIKRTVRHLLARANKVHARPLTIAEWQLLLRAHGLVIEQVHTAPMTLLEPRRLIADEGLLGAVRFIRNLILRPVARRRVLAMRQAFHLNREHLTAVAIIARKPAIVETR